MLAYSGTRTASIRTLRGQTSAIWAKRLSSLSIYTERVDRAVTDCTAKVQKHDPSSFLLSKFLPSYLQPTYLGIRAFGIELSKVSMGQSGSKRLSFGDLKFSFWNEQIDKWAQLTPGELNMHGIHDPISVVIADSIIKGISLDTAMFEQMITSHQHYLHEEAVKGFLNTDTMCSFGEGTFSQMNYLVQSASLTPGLYNYSQFGVDLLGLPETEAIRGLLSDISAHIGQATAVCSFIIGLRYLAQKNDQIALPVDALARNKISQEEALRILQSGEGDPAAKESLKSAIFEITTVANDHILSARDKLSKLKGAIKAEIGKIRNKPAAEINEHEEALKESYSALRKGLPDCIFTPFMGSVPTVLYLERLQKCDFDVLSPKLQFKEWRLAWRTYRDYRKREI